MSPVHDYDLANQSGASFRADLNNALQAILTNNSSASAPSTTAAYMFWADTTTGTLKIRNSSNNGWVELLQLDGTLTLEDGSASAVALGFRDELNTGIFSSGASNFDVSIAGTTRLNISATGLNVTGTVTDDGPTHDGDVTFTGAAANVVFDKSDNALEFADNAKATFGTGADLQLVHDASESLISNTNRGVNLVLKSAASAVIKHDTETMAQFIGDGAVELYHDNAKKAETVSGGFTVTGTCTATAFAGDGSALTGVSSTTINNNADNRVITGSGTANTLNGEADLTFDGNTLTHTVGANLHRITSIAAGDHYTLLEFDSNRASAGDSLSFINFKWDGDKVADIFAEAGADTTNKDDGHLVFRTSPSQGSITQRLKIASDGRISQTTGDLIIDNTNNGYGGLRIVDDSGGEYTVNYIAGRNSGATAHVFKINGRTQNQSPWTNSGSDSECARISQRGISFNGDTAQANALDDYEEGTYTAHFNVEGQSNMTMSGRVGLYIKIGQMVTVMGGGTVASISGQTSGNAIQFTNLPFPVHTTSSGVGHPFPVLMKNMDSTGLGNMSGNQPYSFIGRLFTDADNGRIEAIRADGAQDAVNASLCLAANTEVHYMFTYRTDA